MKSTEKPHITFVEGEWVVIYQNDVPFWHVDLRQVIMYLRLSAPHIVLHVTPGEIHR